MQSVDLLKELIKTQVTSFEKKRSSNRDKYIKLFWSQVIAGFAATIFAGLSFLPSVTAPARVVVLISTAITGSIGVVLASARYKERWEHYTLVVCSLYALKARIEIDEAMIHDQLAFP